MAKENPIILNFAYGELSPYLDARADLKAYYGGCQVLENMVPMIEGPAVRMPGTYFSAETKWGDTYASVLRSYQHNADSGYHLELGNSYIRFFKDGDQVLIDDSMDDFDPSQEFFTGEYTKVGDFININCDGAGKILSISAPYGDATGTITIGCETNVADTLSVGNVASVITIKLADTTPAKNAANLIQVALRALGTVGGIDVSGWFVTENLTYNAARPTAGISVAAAALTAAESVFRSAGVLSSSTTNYNEFPLRTLPSIAEWTPVSIGDPVSISSPYSHSYVSEIKCAKAEGVLYLFHPLYAVRKLECIDNIQWKLTSPTLLNGKHRKITKVTKANPGRVATSKRHKLEDGDTVYIEDVDGMVELNGNTYTVTTDGKKHFFIDADTSGFTTYEDGGLCTKNISATTGDYPSCGSFYEQRLGLAGSVNDPQQINLSRSANYDDFVVDPEEDDSGLEYKIANESDRIRWQQGTMDHLFLGTAGGLWRLSATNNNEPLTQTNVSVKKIINIGVADIEPAMANDAIVWNTMSGETLFKIKYLLETDSWGAEDITKLSKHILKGGTLATSGIRQLAFQKEPRPILWGVRNDGVLIGVAFSADEQIYGSFRITTDGTVESISITSKDGEEDCVMILVRRLVNGSYTRYIEKFMPFNFYSVIEDSFFVHSGLTWDGGASVNISNITAASPPVATAAGHSLSDGDKIRIQGVLGMTEVNIGLTTAYTVANSNTGAGTFELSGIDGSGWTAYTSGGTVTKVANSITLAHLVGETVDIVVDGAVHTQAIVGVAGATSLDYYGNLIHAGIPYTSTLSPMKIHAAAQIGSARGQKKKIHKIFISFYETASAKIGVDLDDLHSIPFGTGVQPELFTGMKTARIDSGWDNDISLYLVQDQPLPMTVVCIIPGVTLNEEI